MSGETVLIVDDNPDNQELTRILLECEGFEVAVAEDAAQALGLLETMHPRLILMDVQLPGIDGLELTRRLRAQEAFRDVVIVALTAYAMIGDEESARSAGCDGYISKPIDTRTFGGKVREYLDQPVDVCASWRPIPTPEDTAPAIRALLPAYLESKRDDLRRIRQALERRDFETIRILGHNMKGTGSGYGLNAVSRIGELLETAARDSSIADIHAQLIALSEVLSAA